MIFADKLINLRKKASMSQEELADKLGVSRQSVSKWEGAQSIPDINKVIELSKIFGVSTDYLLKDDIELEDDVPVEEKSDRKIVTLEDANAYLNVIENSRFITAFGVSLCIISPITLLILAMLTEFNIGISEALASAVGVIVLLVIIAIAVSLFVITGFKTKEYEYLGHQSFETQYGVTGLVKEKKNKYSKAYNTIIMIGVVLCILSVVPLLITVFIENGKYSVLGVSILLAIVAIAVFMFTFAGMKMSAYNMLLQEEDYTKEKKQKSALYGNVMGIFWLTATAIYLAWSFISRDWHITWIVWVIAGILCPVVHMILDTIKKKN